MEDIDIGTKTPCQTSRWDVLPRYLHVLISESTARIWDGSATRKALARFLKKH